MIKQLAYYGAPILRKKSVPVLVIDDPVRALVADMIETMHAQKGVGIAAPQVHSPLALFIVQFPLKGEEKWVPGPIEVFINPAILEVGDQTLIASEGCLSIPDIYEDVPRPDHIKIRAQNLEGQWFERSYDGYDARIVFHENDHINGVLFIDRIDKKRRKMIEPKLTLIKRTKN